jgi:hypothetical protein
MCRGAITPPYVHFLYDIFINYRKLISISKKSLEKIPERNSIWKLYKSTFRNRKKYIKMFFDKKRFSGLG